MTSPGQSIELVYRSVTDDVIRTHATVVSASCPAPPPLVARRLRLEDGTEVRQLLVGAVDRALGYERLDNEILAGLRLARIAVRVGGQSAYPPQVTRLVGYEPDYAEPFALLLPPIGGPVGEVGRRMLPAEQTRFQVSLLEGVRWLAAAGIAHRCLSPDTVRWDRASQQVQISDFGYATVAGVPRTVCGVAPWAVPEQRPQRLAGRVDERDDVWSASQIIFYVVSGEVLTGFSHLASMPALDGLLRDVLTAPEKRPTAVDLLGRLQAQDPMPAVIAPDPLEQGRARFRAADAAKRERLNPRPDQSAAPPPPPSRWAARRRPSALVVGGLIVVLAVLGIVAGLLR